MLPLAFMLGNPTEWVIIAVLAIVLFGGTKLAGLGKSAGEGIREFKKAVRDDEETPGAKSETPVGTITEEKKA